MVAVTVAVVVLAGCADTETTTAPPEIAGPTERVAGVVEQLDRAVRAHDFDAICTGLLTRAARARAGGHDCAAAMAKGAGDVSRPRVRLLSIRIDGPLAFARIESRARDEAPVAQTLQLRRTGRSYRIAALAR